MKRKLSGRGITLLILTLVIVLVTAVMSAAFSGNASPVSNVFGVIMSPFRAASSAVSDFFGNIYSYIYDFEQLKLENSELRVQIAEMEEEIRNSRQALEENERFRRLLELSEPNRYMKYVMANVVSRSSSNWESTFTISKGSAHGISANDCVINEEMYLVGYVSEVGSNWAVVSTLIDSGTELGAIIYRTQGTGVAEGEFTLMGNGKLKLSYLPEGEVILNGDIILTSGVGGVYPKGIEIGTVEQVRAAEGGLGEYAVIAPSVELSRLSQVFIVTEFDISE
jgi:rod shape-determining protein MreC